MMLMPLALLLAASQPITVEAPKSTSEIGYAPGALAYDALISRDYRLAEQQLLQTPKADRKDSAWLINYGKALQHQGRVSEAEQAFREAAALDDGELILADGREVAARVAAELALRQSRAMRQASR